MAQIDRPKRQTLGRPIRPSKQVEVRMRGLMLGLSSRLEQEINALREQFDTPRGAFDALSSLLSNYDQDLNRVSVSIAGEWTGAVNEAERAAMSNLLSRAMGVDAAYIFDSPAVADALLIEQASAANLITDFSRDYISDISQAVLDNFKGLPLPEGRSLTDQIQEIHKMRRSRARLIARDQTSKMTTALNRVRQTSVGIEMYIWRTAMDNRVVGKPGGEWPNPSRAHGNHYQMEGLYCRWDDSTVYSDDKGATWKKRTSEMPTNAPGEDINCRCVATPVIEPQKLTTSLTH